MVEGTLNRIRAALAEIIADDGLILAAAGAHGVSSRFDGRGEDGAFDDLQFGDDEELGREFVILE